MTTNVKWIVFGLCFLAVLAGGAVWYVEAKLAQADAMLHKAVTGAKEAINAPFETVRGVGAQAGESYHNAGVAFEEGVLTPICEFIGIQELRGNSVYK